MYNIIAVDDEIFSLKRFEHIIQKESRVKLSASFTNGMDALEYIKNNTVDIAFLDIEMPVINGLELAERILEIDPYVSVIFVTAFDQYALEAFKAHAIGYLLKPLDIKDFSKEIDSLEHSKKPRDPKEASNPLAEQSSKKLTVKCIGQFSCYAENQPDKPVTFRTAKTAELFALLINKYKSPLSKYAILDTLFPDMDYEKSTKIFYVSCSYLRSAFSKIGVGEILVRDNDTYRIDISIMDCDYINLLDNEPNISNASIETLEKLASLCNGEYLMGRSFDWALETKAYLETLSRRILVALSDAYIDNDNFLEAMQVLEKFLINDPCNEEVVEKLITLYVDDGQASKARAVYNTFATKLKEQFGLKPSEHITKLIQN